MDAADLTQWFQERIGGVATVLHHGLALIGLGAVVLAITQGARLLPLEDASQTAAIAAIRFEVEPLVERVDEREARKYRALASYLSRRYRVASAATEHLVSAAYEAGQQVGLDPLVILAVMAIESRFNPIAESDMGAKGLMQVIPKHHLDKLSQLGGEEAVLDPMTNILLGARILKEYIRLTGSLESGLQYYAGALSDTSSQYAQKVIAEKERLLQAARRIERQPGARDSA